MRNIFNILLFSAMLSLLAAATVPNFLEAQYYQRMARVKYDLPTISAGIEAYKIDYNVYPCDGSQYCWDWPYIWPWYLSKTLTTPVAYLSELRGDPFREDSNGDYRFWNVEITWGTEGTRSTQSVYYDFLKSWYGSWRLGSSGPDKLYGPYWGPPVSDNYPTLPVPYDPTNGLISGGDIEISQKVPAYLSN